MFTVEQYRARAIEYSQLLKIANDPNEVHEYQRLHRSFTELADNAQWAADNHDKTVHAGAMLAMCAELGFHIADDPNDLGVETVTPLVAHTANGAAK
jgi:hypothetical protein